MNYQAKRNVEAQIKDHGSIDITIVPHDASEPREETIINSNYEAVISDIEGYEYENEVYF